MNDQFREVEVTLIENQSLDSILQVFNSVYGKVVYPPVQNYQVVLINKAINYGRMDIVEEVFGRGWPINGPYPSRPLHTACGEGRHDFVRFLLDKGADVNTDANSLGREGWSSPMYFALAHDDIDLMNLLMPHFRVRKNVTPLHFACMQGAVKCAKFLLEGHYYSPDHMADNFSMPLEIAVRTSSVLTELLIQHGAPLCHHRKDCMAVIHHAIHPYSVVKPVRLVHCGIADIVKILIDAGADVNMKYQSSNLIEMFFQHIPVLCQCINNKEESLDHLVKFWEGLLHAAKLVVKAGLKSETLKLTLTYQSHLGTRCSQYRHRLQMISVRCDSLELALAMSFKRSSELLYIFISGITDAGTDLSNIVSTTLQLANRVFDHMNEYSRWTKSLVFCEALHDVLRLQYLNLPSQAIPVDSLMNFFQTLVSDDYYQMSGLLDLIILFVPLKLLHDSQGLISSDLISYRLSLKCLTKLAVISSLPCPREGAISSLQIPKALRECLLLIK